MNTASPNTSDISIFLYLFFVLIALAGMAFIFYLITKSKLESDKIDRIIDVFKSVIITSAIGTVTLIIADQFKERKQDLDEMTAFKDYLPYVTDSTSSLDDKIYFCKFMVAAAPEGALRVAWQHWESDLLIKDSLIKSLSKQIKTEEAVMEKQPEKATQEQIAHVLQLEAQKQNILQDVKAKISNTFLVVLGADKTLNEAQPELMFAKNIDQAATVYKKGSWYRTVIPVPSNYDDAKRIADLVINQPGRKRQAYIVSLKSWCKTTNFSQKDSCTLCN